MLGATGVKIQWTLFSTSYTRSRLILTTVLWCRHNCCARLQVRKQTERFSHMLTGQRQSWGCRLGSPPNAVPVSKWCEFPGDATTSCYKPGGLKQQKLVLSLFWRPEVQNPGVSRALPCFPWGSFLFSSSFWRLQTFLHAWLHHSHLLLCLCVAFYFSVSVSPPCISL